MTLRQLARQTADVFEFVRRAQSCRFTGCTGARELAAVWYRINASHVRKAA